MRKNKFKTISLIIFLISLILISFIATPVIVSLKDEKILTEFVDKFGIWSAVALLFIQIFQSIAVFVPSEIIEFASGSLFGWFGGFLLCISGAAVGEIVVFKLVSVLGAEFAQKVAGSKIVNRFKFLNDEKKLKSVTFWIFFIPGTPKALITYLMPLTKIKMKDFIIISLIARIPSVISSTYGGDAFAEKNFLVLAILYIGVFLFTTVGYVVYKKWEARYGNKH